MLTSLYFSILCSLLAMVQAAKYLHPTNSRIPEDRKIRQAYGAIFHCQEPMIINEYSHLQVLFQIQLPTTVNLTRWPIPQANCPDSIESKQCGRYFEMIMDIRGEYHKILDDIFDLQHQIKILLQQPITRTPGNRRTSRGLVNVIGSVSKWLFGTATEADVTELLNRVNELQTTGSRLSQ